MMEGKAFVADDQVETVRQSWAATDPCVLVAYHAPAPVATEWHHYRAVFLQKRLYGREKYGADYPLCGNCHDAVHAWLYWLLGMRSMPPNMGRAAKAEAQKSFDWYVAEATALNRTDLLEVLP